MIRERYNDKRHLIADAEGLRLANATEVIIYREDQWYSEVVVDLEGQADKFDELKSFIALVAGNLCKMDCIAQKYDGNYKFTDCYEVAYIRLGAPDRIILTYYGIMENTEFDVVFQHINGEFILRSFGLENLSYTNC